MLGEIDRSQFALMPIRGAEMVASQQNATARPRHSRAESIRAEAVVTIQVPSDLAIRKLVHQCSHSATSMLLNSLPCCLPATFPRLVEFAHTIPTIGAPASRRAAYFKMRAHSLQRVIPSAVTGISRVLIRAPMFTAATTLARGISFRIVRAFLFGFSVNTKQKNCIRCRSSIWELIHRRVE